MFHLAVQIAAILFIFVCAVSVVCIINGTMAIMRDSKKQADKAQCARRRLRARRLEALQRYSWEHLNQQAQGDTELIESLLRAELDEPLAYPLRNTFVN